MAARGSKLSSTDDRHWLDHNDYLVSENRAFCACLHVDGNLVIYAGPEPGVIKETLWHASDTSSASKWHAALNQDKQTKRLVLYNTGVICCDDGDPNHQFWSHNPEVPASPNGPKCMVLHDDGNLCCYDSADPNENTMIWDTGSKNPIQSMEVSSIDYDIDKITTSAPQIQGLYFQTVHNGTSKEQNSTLSVSETVTETQSWNHSVTIGVTLEQSVKVSVPKVAEEETKLSLKAEQTLTFNKAEEVSREWKLVVPLNVPANTTVKVLVTIALTEITVPYTVKGSYILGNGIRIPGMKATGTFIGKNSHNLTVDYKESSDPKTTPPETINKPQREIKAVVVADALHIRSSHYQGAKILGFLKKRDEVAVLETWTQGNQIWVKIKPGTHLEQPAEQWCAMLVGSSKYVQILNDLDE